MTPAGTKEAKCKASKVGGSLRTPADGSKRKLSRALLMLLATQTETFACVTVRGTSSGDASLILQLHASALFSNMTVW